MSTKSLSWRINISLRLTLLINADKVTYKYTHWHDVTEDTDSGRLYQCVLYSVILYLVCSNADINKQVTVPSSPDVTLMTGGCCIFPLSTLI